MKAWLGLSVLLFAGGCGGSTPTPATESEPAAEPAAEATSEATPEATPEETAETPPEPAESEPATLVGAWSVDPECIPRQRGMEGADPATVEAVAAQMAQVRYVYTETEFESHNSALPQPVTQPYTVLRHEGASWTYELAGPTGAPMEIEATLVNGQLQLRRQGALELCLRRSE